MTVDNISELEAKVRELTNQAFGIDAEPEITMVSDENGKDISHLLD